MPFPRKRRLPSIILRFLAAALALALVRPPQVGAEARPHLVSRTPAGIAAYDSLTAWYQRNDDPDPYGPALDELVEGDSVQARRAEEFLLAFVAQAQTDASTGRAPRYQTPYWGGGSESPASRSMSDVLDGLDVAPERATRLLEWFVFEDRNPQRQRDAAWLLIGGRGYASDGFVHRVIRDHDNPEVIIYAVREAAARRTTGEAQLVGRLVNHPLGRVRAVAESVSVVLNRPAHASTNPGDWLTPELENELRLVADAVHPRPDRDAPMVRLRITTFHADRRQKEFVWRAARVVAADSSKYRLIDLRAREMVVIRASATVEAWSLAQEIDRIIAADPDAETDMLTGQFEPRGLALPEILLAAWSVEQKDRRNAARVLLPGLEKVGNQTLLPIARLLLVTAYKQRMLEAFSYDWDYRRAAGYARALQAPLFAGASHVAVSREFERQLTTRTDDFVTFMLPDSAAWDSIRRKTGREEQISYLAPRLRLLNAFQYSQPGGVAFSEQQYATPSHRRSSWDDGVPRFGRRINPMVELDKLDLVVNDIPVLLRYFSDTNYLPTFGFWREFHPGRTPYQVGEIIEWLVNASIDQSLVSFDDYIKLGPAERRGYIARIEAWARPRAGWTRDQLTLDALKTTTAGHVFRMTAQKAAERGLTDAAPLIARRRVEFPQYLASELDAILAKFDSTAITRVARDVLLPADDPQWQTRSREPGLVAQQLWASWVVLRGDRDSIDAALVSLERVADADATGKVAIEAAPRLIATDSCATVSIWCGQLEKPDFRSFSVKNDSLLKSLIDCGCEKAASVLLSRFPPNLRQLEYTYPPYSLPELSKLASQWPGAPRIDPDLRVGGIGVLAERARVSFGQMEAFKTWLLAHARSRSRR